MKDFDQEKEFDFLAMETILLKYNYLSKNNDPDQTDSKKLREIKVKSVLILTQRNLQIDLNTQIASLGTGLWHLFQKKLDVYGTLCA